MIQDALSAARCPLPFVREAVSTDRRLQVWPRRSPDHGQRWLRD
jgi:hypothetical protein